jgi:hypothetical protein
MPAIGTARHHRQRRRQRDEARSGDARRPLGRQHGHGQQQDLLLQAQMDAQRLGDEQGRHRHIDVGAVQIERIARRHDQPDHRLGRPGPLHLLQQAGKRGFRRGGAQHQQQLFLQVTDQLEDIEPIGDPDQAEDADHEQDGGQIEGRHQSREIGDRADPVGPDGEGEGPEGADGRGLHQDGDQLEEGRRDRFQEAQHRLAEVADQGQRDAEQDRDEQDLQDVAGRKGADHGVGDDPHQEALNGRLMRRAGILGHGPGVQGRGVDVQPPARLDHIGDDQAEDQSQRREDEEIGEGLGRHPPDLAQIAHARDAGHDGQEDHRRDDHLHQLDEGVAQRLQRLAELRPEMTDHRTQHDRRQHLEIQMRVEGLLPMRRSTRSARPPVETFGPSPAHLRGCQITPVASAVGGAHQTFHGFPTLFALFAWVMLRVHAPDTQPEAPSSAPPTGGVVVEAWIAPPLHAPTPSA